MIEANSVQERASLDLMMYSRQVFCFLSSTHCRKPTGNKLAYMTVESVA